MIHTFEPVYDEKSRVLILGSFPSVKSREAGFYYYHPKNRFWHVLSTITEEKEPATIEQKRDLLYRHGIAVWDVVYSCDILGSSDASIKNVVPADISMLLSKTKIRKIYANGAKAEELYNRYCQAKTGVEICRLPSTSPANAAWTINRLVESWKVIVE